MEPQNRIGRGCTIRVRVRFIGAKWEDVPAYISIYQNDWVRGYGVYIVAVTFIGGGNQRPVASH
jgi:hypothetical protein